MLPFLRRRYIVIMVSLMMLLAGCGSPAEGDRGQISVVQTATAPLTIPPNPIVGAWTDTNATTESRVWHFYVDGTVEMHYAGDDPAKPMVTGGYKLEGTTLSLSLFHPNMESATEYVTEVHIEGSEMTIGPHPSDGASFVVGRYRRVP